LKVICIIPARLDSARFPEKIFTQIHGMPMFAKVYHIAKQSGLFTSVLVASADERVLKYGQENNIQVVLTRGDHPCGSSRVFEAARSVHEDWDIVVNLQADQPFLPTSYLKTVVEAVGANPIATIAYEEAGDKDEHTVKVIRNKKGEGVYFSRYPIPYSAPGTSEVVRLCHLGLYAYKKEFALSYEGDFKSALALQESLEQLDFIHHGYKIDVAIVPHSVPEVNVPEDLVLAQKLGLL
jgi:3-deoxy-manno-octulosonate cytidylyltransferase (CMP-KDO synthetase)